MAGKISFFSGFTLGLSLKNKGDIPVMGYEKGPDNIFPLKSEGLVYICGADKAGFAVFYCKI